jgi:fatty-acyl-CoA synthase
MAMSERSYESGPATQPLLGDTIGRAFERTVSAQPDADALVSRHQDVRLTYRELSDRVLAAARGLLAAGIERGDRVGIWSPTNAEWTILQFASARVGAILVNVNPSYRVNELAYALKHSGVRLLVAAEGFRGADYLAMIDEVRADLPALDRVVVIGRDWDDFVAAGDAVPASAVVERENTLDADDPINIQYTSGTTGNPKGATLTHHNILNNARDLGQLLGYSAADRVAIPVPLYHCFGMGIGNLGCVTAGAAMVYPAEAFDALATLQAISEEKCTSIYGVPTMFIGMLEHPDFRQYDMSSLRTGIMAGAPCPIEVMKRAVDEMNVSEVTIAYGMTETSPVSFITRRSDSIDRRVSTVGTVLPGVEAKVIDPATGDTVPRGTPGEVCTRGYLVMRGYWDNDDATRDAIDPAGWMHTGDLGVMDEEGYLNIVGRSKDMVIRGGENLYPREIEELIFQHPAVASVQVIGVPDVKMGEELMAWVALRDGASLDAEELREWCKERVARFKVPRYVKFTDEFPMTVTGKIQKFKMRAEAIDELGLHDAASIQTA